MIKSATNSSRENTQPLLCTLCAIHPTDNSAEYSQYFWQVKAQIKNSNSIATR